MQLHTNTRAHEHTNIQTYHHTYIHTCIHYTTLHYVTLQYTTLHYITLHYLTLHCIALHYITLHYNTMQYNAICYIFTKKSNREKEWITIKVHRFMLLSLRYTYLHIYIHTYDTILDIQSWICTHLSSYNTLCRPWVKCTYLQPYLHNIE